VGSLRKCPGVYTSIAKRVALRRLQLRSSLLPLLGAILVALAAACPRAGVPLDAETGVEVRVFKAPIQPVVREDESSEAPVAGAVVLVEPLAGGETRQVLTDSAGIARLLVLPGMYRISIEECPGAMAPPKEPADISVTAGSFSSVKVVCDTGIR
jgi:hypothetical protein